MEHRGGLKPKSACVNDRLASRAEPRVLSFTVKSVRTKCLKQGGSVSALASLR